MQYASKDFNYMYHFSSYMSCSRNASTLRLRYRIQNFEIQWKIGDKMCHVNEISLDTNKVC